MSKVRGNTCSYCGEYQKELPTRYGSPAPVYYYYIKPEERENRIELDDDLCIIDNEHFFIHGCIEIPIIGTDEHPLWGVGGSLSKANFNKTKELWEMQE